MPRVWRRRADGNRERPAGLDKDVRAAEKKLDALVARVAKSLAPLGVTGEDVHALIERRLVERWCPTPDGE